MVLQYQNIPTRRSTLRRILGTTVYGTPSSNLTKLKSLGLRVIYKQAQDEQELREALARGIPPICLVETENIGYWQGSAGHAVVVVDMNSSAVVVNDPAYADERQTIPLDTFLLAWVERDYLYALLTIEPAH